MLIALSYQNASFLPIYVGLEKGFFAREGLDLDYVYVLEGGKTKTVRLAVQGEIAFLDGVSTSVEAVVRGWGQVKVLCAGVCEPSFLMVRPHIKATADLKGRRVMAGGEGGRDYNMVLRICKQQGWEPGRDITIVRGSQADRIEAFQDPGIDAVAARVQFWHWAEKCGFQRLSYEGSACWYSGGLAAPTRLIEESPDKMRKAVKAYLAAIAYIKANREEAIRIIMKNVPYLDYEGAAGNYDVLHDLWNPVLEPAGVEDMAEFFRQTKGATRRPGFEELADMRFLKEVMGAGIKCGVFL